MPTPSPTGPTHPARRAVVGAALALLVLVAVGCTGDDAATDTSTGTTQAPDERSVDDPLAVTAYADPAAPITAAVGERFALLLDAEPTEGFRWEVVSQGDPAVVLPLGSQFVARDTLAPTTTTTSAPPPVPDPAAPPVEDPPSSEPPASSDPPVPAPEDGAAVTEAPVAPGPPAPAPTTTTVPTRSLQVLSYVARAAGRTTITVRYVRIGAAAASSLPDVTFTVEVVPAPPLF